MNVVNSSTISCSSTGLHSYTFGKFKCIIIMMTCFCESWDYRSKHIFSDRNCLLRMEQDYGAFSKVRLLRLLLCVFYVFYYVFLQPLWCVFYSASSTSFMRLLRLLRLLRVLRCACLLRTCGVVSSLLTGGVT